MDNRMIIQPMKKELVDINGNALRVDGADAVNLQLHNAFSSVRNITASCFSIQQTIFGQVTPKPDWYDGLQEKFNVVKSYADTWLNDYSVAVTATIPSSVINFVPLFQASTDMITSITNNTPGKLSKAQKETISAILVKMISKVDEISAEVQKYAYTDPTSKTAGGLLIDWQAGISKATGNLMEGNETVQNAAVSLSQTIKELNDEIAALKLDIEYYNKLISTGAGMVGTGAFTTAVGGAICLVFPVAGGIVACFGLGSIIAGGAVWGIYQNKINQSSVKISKYLSEVQKNDQTLAAINILSQASTSVVSYAQMAIDNMSRFATSWMVFGDSLKETLYRLNNANNPDEVIGSLVGVEMYAAKGQWNNVKDYAQQLLEAPSEVRKVNAGEINAVA